MGTLVKDTSLDMLDAHVIYDGLDWIDWIRSMYSDAYSLRLGWMLAFFMTERLIHFILCWPGWGQLSIFTKKNPGIDSGLKNFPPWVKFCTEISAFFCSSPGKWAGLPALPGHWLLKWRELYYFEQLVESFGSFIFNDLDVNELFMITEMTWFLCFLTWWMAHLSEVTLLLAVKCFSWWKRLPHLIFLCNRWASGFSVGW